MTVESLNPGTTTPAAGSTGQMSVELSADAPSGGSVVTFASSNSSDLSVPASVTVAAGEDQDDFSYTAGNVTTPTAVTVTATLGSSSASVTLTVTPVSLFSLEFDPSDVVVSGATVTVEPDLSGPAPAGGAVVSLTSSNPSLAPVPATAEIPAGDYLIPGQRHDGHGERGHRRHVHGQLGRRHPDQPAGDSTRRPRRPRR